MATAIGSCTTGGGLGGICWGEGRLDPALLRLEPPTELTWKDSKFSRMQSNLLVSFSTTTASSSKRLLAGWLRIGEAALFDLPIFLRGGLRSCSDKSMTSGGRLRLTSRCSPMSGGDCVLAYRCCPVAYVPLNM